MHIGQLAKIACMDRQTIRFYEQQGLITPPVRQENGYRLYTEQHVDRLAFIHRCRILNLSLTEIRELQGYQDDPHQPCTAVNIMLDKHISQIRAQINALQTLERQLVSLRSSCNEGREINSCGILTGINDECKKPSSGCKG
ncbi:MULTISPECIES: Cd(II)/Pb(II)-responsive transcriptional regulator [Pseudomonadaceae]|uniref:Cd(II)/Pb(II)-responsive transcriptional regulator n=1 Tax=Pseudomonadaceae TaxID=135621 RepID=UPI0007B90834|nr:Cd(II)/Pb(II)-responsive transcriptional regulator [Stutzerimonas frequens]HCI3982909.1 Cd(II)/Pb(II)-responsive transcriptional regulator [Pseudomonas aeruginosa]KZX54685.1 Cd(II)/Pb(II)-responsive transcriptional regulator [Stutzerimonas frequens]MBK3874667.1 Cd(II)/Pb(II)-responsive transcriptional regulator [Stutzerimonas frequens]MBK3912936.1 Cd(II)/Pb(II)-responsive transcriptional regulator [Stutzerimonas frequens]MBK3932182.1 Cd(II)/Pb(II)-responsive transcriptional regulator [Stutz